MALFVCCLCVCCLFCLNVCLHLGKTSHQHIRPYGDSLAIGKGRSSGATPSNSSVTDLQQDRTTNLPQSKRMASIPEIIRHSQFDLSGDRHAIYLKLTTITIRPREQLAL